LLSFVVAVVVVVLFFFFLKQKKKGRPSGIYLLSFKSQTVSKLETGCTQRTAPPVSTATYFSPTVKRKILTARKLLLRLLKPRVALGFFYSCDSLVEQQIKTLNSTISEVSIPLLSVAEEEEDEIQIRRRYIQHRQTWIVECYLLGVFVTASARKEG
jgi:hypothetical protein